MSTTNNPTAPKRPFQFSLRTGLLVVTVCALFCGVRAMVFRYDSHTPLFIHAMWGRTIFALVGGALAARAANRAGARRWKILLLGTLGGSVAAILFVIALTVELSVKATLHDPAFFRQFPWWETAKLMFYYGAFFGALFGAAIALLWLVPPKWRYAISATLIVLCGSFGVWLANEIQRARLEAEALEKFAGGVDYKFNVRAEPELWFPLNPTIVGYLQEQTRRLVCETVDTIRLGQLTLPLGKIECSELPPLKNVRKLTLQSSQLADHDLAALAELPHLEELWLIEPDVTDAGLEHLHSLKSLKVVALTFTKVTPAGEARLKETLPNCKIEHRELTQATLASPYDTIWWGWPPNGLDRDL